MPTPSTARLQDFTVVSNDPIADGVYALVISAPELSRSVEPGQFVELAVPGNAMSLLRIPFSFADADPERGTVDIWYAVRGEGTERLTHMAPGDASTLIGPGGHGWTVPAGCGRAMLVGGGVGVPPILHLARLLSARGIPFDVCTGARTAAALIGVDEFRSLPGCGEVVVRTDDGSAGERGFCTDPAAEMLAAGGYGYAATCGPAVMMKKVAAAAAAAGVRCEVSMERMMSCGFGACNTCNVETVDGMKGACTCGPVFDATKVVTW